MEGERGTGGADAANPPGPGDRPPIARRVRSVVGRLVVPALALVTAFIVGAIFLILTDIEHMQALGTDPLGALAGAVDLVLRGYGAIVAGAIGDPGRILAAIQSGNEQDIARAIRPITEGLLFATPLVFVTLGVGVALHARLFNFGAEGQFIIGGLGATLTAVTLDGVVAPFGILLAAVVGGVAFGAAYGFVPGLLKARTGAHEVITTLMLNTIAAQIVIYVGRTVPMPKPLSSITSIPLLFDIPTIRIDWGFVAALLFAALTWFLLFRTRLGFELRATGFSVTAARSAGMRPARVTVVAMALSGALVGLGGALLALGPAGRLSGTGFGFEALALALLGGLRPSGMVLAAILYGVLNNGAKTMVVATGTPLALLVVIIALVLMFVAAPGLIRSLWRLKPPASDVTSFQPSGAGSPL